MNTTSQKLCTLRGLLELKFADKPLPLDQVGPFVERADALVEARCPGASTSPLGHLGDGNLHFGIFAGKYDPEEFRRSAESLKGELLDLLHSFGGSFSAEHGIGCDKLAEMSRYKDPVAVELMRAIKQVLDPANILNPGKVIPTADS